VIFLLPKYTKTDLIIKQAQKEGIVLDTCVLSIFLTGIYEEKKKITGLLDKVGGTVEDFQILKQLLPTFENYLTPHVLAETQGILTKCFNNETALDIIKEGLLYLLDMNENQIEKDDILQKTELNEFGIIDVSLLLCSEEHKKIILTLDHRLEEKSNCILSMRILRAYYYTNFQ